MEPMHATCPYCNRSSMLMCEHVTFDDTPDPWWTWVTIGIIVLTILAFAIPLTIGLVRIAWEFALA